MTTAEIRTYEGDGADLADLIRRVWTTAFAHRMWFPLWNQPYLRWRLLDPRAGGGDFLIAAYRGTTLVGCLLAEPLTVNVRGTSVRATLSSFLSVDPSMQRSTLGLRLVEELRRRQQEQGVRVSIGCAHAIPRRFWDTLAKRNPLDRRPIGPLRFWTRVLNGRAVSRAGFTRFERIGARAAGLLPQPRREVKTNGTRPYTAADGSRCLEWVHRQSANADLHIVWTEPRLQLQLGHEFVRTLVADAGAEGGFVNYYTLDWSGDEVIRVAMIDLFAGTLPWRGQTTLLQRAVRHMADDGVQMALMMVSAAAPPAPLLAAGFVPLPADVELFTLFPDPALRLDPPLRYHLLFT